MHASKSQYHFVTGEMLKITAFSVLCGLFFTPGEGECNCLLCIATENIELCCQGGGSIGKLMGGG